MAQSIRQRHGIGLVEVLLALAIGAVLLAAIALALGTIISSTKTNQSMLQARQNANSSLNFILTHVRRARGLALDSPTAAANEYLVMTTTDQSAFDPATGTWANQFTTFRYDPAQRTLSIGHGPSATPAANPVLHNVSNLAFRSVLSTDGTHTYVTIEICVDIPDAFSAGTPSASRSYTISGSAVSRAI